MENNSKTTGIKEKLKKKIPSLYAWVAIGIASIALLATYIVFNAQI